MSRQCRRPSPAPPSSRTIHYCIVSLTFLLNYAVVILVSARIPPLPSHHCVNSNQQLNEMHICTNLGLIKRKSREKEIDVTDRLGSLYSSRIIHPTSRVVFRWRAWERNGCKRGFGQPVTSQFENKIGPCKFTTHGQYENIAYGSRKLAEKPPMPIVIAAAAAAGRGPGPEARPSWHHSRNYHHWPTALAFASQLLRVSLSLSLCLVSPPMPERATTAVNYSYYQIVLLFWIGPNQQHVRCPNWQLSRQPAVPCCVCVLWSGRHHLPPPHSTSPNTTTTRTLFVFWLKKK